MHTNQVQALAGLKAAWLAADMGQIHSIGVIPAFSSDGLNQYFYSIITHWESWTVVADKC